MLLKDERATVTDDAGNSVTIRAKMNYQTRGRVMDAMLDVTGAGAQSVHVGAGNMALLEHNILAWEGPAFTDPATGRPYPCTAENIRSLDPDEPLVDKVLAEINRRNQKAAASPKDTTPGADG